MPLSKTGKDSNLSDSSMSSTTVSPHSTFKAHDDNSLTSTDESPGILAKAKEPESEVVPTNDQSGSNHLSNALTRDLQGLKASILVEVASTPELGIGMDRKCMKEERSQDETQLNGIVDLNSTISAIDVVERRLPRDKTSLNLYHRRIKDHEL